MYRLPFSCYYFSPIRFGARSQSKLKTILSKWEIMFADESIELIDITDQLVAMFSPDDATQKIIDNIKAMVPIPIGQVPIDPMK